MTEQPREVGGERAGEREVLGHKDGVTRGVCWGRLLLPDPCTTKGPGMCSEGCWSQWRVRVRAQW